MVKAVKLAFKHLEQHAAQIPHIHRTERDVRETVDRGALAEMVDEELRQAALPAQRPAIEIDARNDRPGISLEHGLFTFQLRLGVYTLRIRLVSLPIGPDLVAAKHRVR